MLKVMATPKPKARATEKPFKYPRPMESGTITKASGRVQGSTIIDKPDTKLNKYQPAPIGELVAEVNSHSKPVAIIINSPRARLITKYRPGSRVEISAAVCGGLPWD